MQQERTCFFKFGGFIGSTVQKKLFSYPVIKSHFVFLKSNIGSEKKGIELQFIDNAGVPKTNLVNSVISFFIKGILQIFCDV